MSATSPTMPMGRPINESTDRALENTILSPRFYTTDFDEMDRFDISSVKPEWDRLMQEFDQDINQAHFQRPEDMSKDYSHLPEGLYQEFLDFLISSITSEFSGCVLYSEIKKSINNPELKNLFSYMARDESRHAGFINQWLKDFGIGVDLGFLARTKKYTFFKPKFIFYATMYVRDHSRPEFHNALGVSPTDYDRQVLKITSDISKQVFPFTINLDDPRVWKGFEKLRKISDEVEELKLKGGLFSTIKRGALAVSAAATFVHIYLLPVVPNELPADIRLAPVW